jgi:uncharacterized RDD family membrane protein YckC
MLFPDLSAPQANKNEARFQKPAIAFIADRFLALVLDFLIFSPIVSLFVAGMVRQTKTFFLLDFKSAEGYIAASFMVGYSVALIIFLQSVFLFFWQATPGQLFLQMRVKSYPVPRARLTYPQCLLRAFCWTVSCVTFGIPFLEIISHPLRRAFHERASDTVVVTLKKESDPGPMPVEERFISSWMRLSFLFAIVFVTIFALRGYQDLLAGNYKTTDNNNLYCSEIKSDDFQGTSRLDAAVSLYLLNSITAECLGKEAEASLWADPVRTSSLAYLAKYVVADASEQKEYLAKICQVEKSKECALGRYMAGEVRSLKDFGANASWTEQVLRVEELYQEGDFIGSLDQIGQLQKNSLFEQALEKKFVRSIWALKENNKRASGGRVPASADNSKHWLEVFKGKYSVE